MRMSEAFPLSPSYATFTVFILTFQFILHQAQKNFKTCHTYAAMIVEFVRIFLQLIYKLLLIPHFINWINLIIPTGFIFEHLQTLLKERATTHFYLFLTHACIEFCLEN